MDFWADEGCIARFPRHIRSAGRHKSSSERTGDEFIQKWVSPLLLIGIPPNNFTPESEL